MRLSKHNLFTLGLLLLGSSEITHAGTPASPQAPPVPLNLPVIGNVQVTGSDSRASTFNSQWLPQFQTIINNNLQESVVFTNATGFTLETTSTLQSSLWSSVTNAPQVIADRYVVIVDVGFEQQFFRLHVQ